MWGVSSWSLNSKKYDISLLQLYLGLIFIQTGLDSHVSSISHLSSLSCPLSARRCLSTLVVALSTLTTAAALVPPPPRRPRRVADLSTMAVAVAAARPQQLLTRMPTKRRRWLTRVQCGRGGCSLRACVAVTVAHLCAYMTATARQQPRRRCALGRPGDGDDASARPGDDNFMTR